MVGRRFQARAEEEGYSPLPCSAELLANHAAWLAARGYSPATTALRVTAVGARLRELGLRSPTANDLIRQLLRGIRRRRPRPPRIRRPFSREELAAVAKRLQDGDALARARGSPARAP